VTYFSLGVKFYGVQGWRERKKAATRLAISDVATRLFEQRGFERVTMAEIAEAASVSVKTIFNYFGTKEELFFDREDEMLELLLTTLRERPHGTSAAAAVRPGLLDGPIPMGSACRWSDLEGDLYDGIRNFISCELSSPTLSARRLVIANAWVAPLGRETGSEAWAAMFIGLLNLRHATLGSALLERRAPRTVERRVRAVVGDGLDALDRAFPEG
jgi:AcrR family transcriptional regulator